jgi:hypothetical protein
MRRFTRPVAWRNGGDERFVGKAAIDVVRCELVLDGSAPAPGRTRARVELRGPALAAVQIARDGGLPAVSFDHDGHVYRVELLTGGWGAAHALAHEVAALAAATAGERERDCAGPAQRQATMDNGIVFVARIRPGQRDALDRLFRDGPPFDPAAVGLTGHSVYLGDDEAVFLFRAPDPVAAVKRLSAEPGLLRDTLRIAGMVHPPHFVNQVYAWEPERAEAPA